jgi:bla regulator protein blaR1
MIAWMIYAILVTLALSAAALLAERAAKVRRAATRWVWMASLACSLVLPTVIAKASLQLPTTFKSGTTSASIVLRDTTSIPMPPVLLDLEDAQTYTTSDRIDALMRDIWMAASVLMLLMLALSSMLLYRRKRGWNEGYLCGERVLVAPDAGPAAIGLIRSRIVVPAWLLQASEEQQQCTIAHERSHLLARDPQLVALALVLLTLMPWNPLLWWQFHRLRRAIEVDCDARVLWSGHDVGAYCETLIQVGQHQSNHIGLVPAMSDSASFLELRIRHMLRKPNKWARASAAVLVCVSLGMAAFAAQVVPPDTSHWGTNAPVVLSSDTLDHYTGYYYVSPISAITVTRAGDGLIASVSGQMAAPEPYHLIPLSKTRFAIENMDATVHFITDAHGDALRLVATDNKSGRDFLDRPRTDKATADQANAALAARIKAQKPFPGSEKALQLLLSDPDSDAGMSADLAWVRRQQKASREKYLAEIGPVESYTFLGVSKFGQDAYLVKRQHGTETIYLVVDPDGSLATAVRRSSLIPAPPKT